MARTKQEVLNKEQMLALAYKIKRPDMSNKAIAEEVNVSRETIRLWFSRGGETIVAKCYRAYKATGEIYPLLEEDS